MAYPKNSIVAQWHSPKKLWSSGPSLCANTLSIVLKFEHQRLLPMVWKNLSQSGGAVPGGDKLLNLYRHTHLTNLGRQRSCETVLEALQENGVQVIVLKGTALNIDVYGDLGARPAHDFDLLVRFAQVDEALAISYGQGWTADEELRPQLRLEHGGTLRKGKSEFDLHWFAMREAREVSFDEALWRRAVPLQVGRVKSLMLCPEHQLFHLLVNGTREPENCYRFLLDLTLFLRKYGDQVDMEEVFMLLRERHLSHRLTYLPWAELGVDNPFPQYKAPMFDRCWSWCTRYIHGGSGELVFGVFPFLDYFLHFTGVAESRMSPVSYFEARVGWSGVTDFVTRVWHKLLRTLRSYR